MLSLFYRRFSRFIFAVGLATLVASAVVAQAIKPDASEAPEPYRSLTAKLQARFADLPIVELTPVEGPAILNTFSLNKKPVVYESGQAFDAVRFRVPEGAPSDMVWAFQITAGWRHWYIIPASGAPESGFRNWLNGDRAYEGLGGEFKNPVTLQTLAAESLKPGKDYILWFSQAKHTEGPVTLKVILGFAPRPTDDKGWNAEAIEKALNLKAASTEAQVAYFESRGGRILCDPSLFKPEDATSQMDSLLTAIRLTTATRDGYFMTVEMISPPCHATPKLSEVIARHGPPDVVLTAAHANALREKETDEPTTVDRYYFDRFIFETPASNTLGKIERVGSQYSSTAQDTPRATGFTWADFTLTAQPFRVFYRDGQEVGRFVFWGKPAARRLGALPPEGLYQTNYDDGAVEIKMQHDGKGNWLHASYYHSGPVYRKCYYKDGILDGALTDYFENGKPRVEATYSKGVLHGRLRVWSETGEVQRDQLFAEGRPASETEAKNGAL